MVARSRTTSLDKQGRDAVDLTDKVVAKLGERASLRRGAFLLASLRRHAGLTESARPFFAIHAASAGLIPALLVSSAQNLPSW
jgi:hypothetical protein